MFFVIMEKGSERVLSATHQWADNVDATDVLFFRTPGAADEHAKLMARLSILLYYVVMVDPSRLSRVQI